MATLFDNVANAQTDATLFDNIKEESAGPSSVTPIKTLVTAAARMNRDSPAPAIDLGESTLRAVDDALNAGQENAIRSQVALQRMTRTAQSLKKYRNNVDNILNPDLAAKIDHAYNVVTSQDINRQKQVALEAQAYENVQDLLTHGNDVEAKVVYDNIAKGGAYEVQRDNAIKNLRMAQLGAKFDQELQGQGWGNYMANFIINMIPTKEFLGKLGIIPDSGVGVIDRIFTGRAIEKQANNLWHMPLDDFMEFTKEGGQFETAMRSHARELGVTDPSFLVETHKQFSNGVSPNDKAWASLWGIGDVAGAATMVPWSKLGSVTGALTRMGARKAAVRQAVNAMEAVSTEGTAAATAKTGMAATEVEEAAGTSLTHPTFSENEVPLGVDVDTHLQAARDAVRQMNADNLVSRITDPQELQNAYDGLVNKLEKQYGHPIKDYKPMIEDLSSGQHYEYTGQLPVHGKYVPYIEVTFGKTEGGGFATAEAAENAARGSGFGKHTIFGEEVVVGEKRITPADEGYNIRAYHGTGADFEEFDMKFAGSHTMADDANGALFFSSDSEVAGTYAKAAGQQKLQESKAFQTIQDNYFTNKAIIDSVYRKLKKNAVPIDDVSGPYGKDYDFATALQNGDPDEFLSKFKGVTRQELEHYFARKNAYDKAVEAYTVANNEKHYGNIRPVNLKMTNPHVVNMQGMGYDSTRVDAEVRYAKQNGHDGVIFQSMDDSFGNGFHDVPVPMNSDIYAIFDPQQARSIFEPDRVIKDVSGQYFFKGRVNVPETGFYTNPLNPPRQSFLARWFQSSARISDAEAHAKAVTADSQIDRAQKIIGRKLKEAAKGLNKVERNTLDQILLAGQNKAKWYTDSEFNAGYERLTGKPASAKALQAYKNYRLLNDMDWVLRNDEVYMNKSIRGFDTLSFNAGDLPITLDGKVNWSPDVVPRERVFNATENRHYTTKNPLSQAELDHLRGEGYVLVDLETGTQISDGTYIKKVLIHKSDLEVKPLEREQLPYSEGGHRLYKDKYFGKQASRGIQPDTGTEYLTNPNVFVTFANKKEGEIWSRTMNEALDYVKNGGVDPQHLDDNIFKGHKGYMSGREFIDAYQGGMLGDDRFEVTFDREMPSAYTDRPANVSLYIDEGDTGFNDYYRTTGRMYYSSKGKALKTFDSSMPDTASEFATTVDPWEALSTSLYNITRNTGLSNYKTSIVDRFIRTFRNDLNLDGLTEEELNSPVAIFNNSTVKRGISIERQQQIEAQRMAIQRVLGFESSTDKFYRQFTRSTAEWVLGLPLGQASKALHDSVWWVRDSNPLNVIHGLAFDAKLGLFNVGQFFVQTSTMFSATAMSPKYGIQGMFGTVPLHAYLLAKPAVKENVLDVLAKRGIGKLMGFETETEFKQFARYMDTNGFHDVSGTHVMVQNYGPSAAFSSFGGDVREAGRAPFYAAEVWNRIVANRIAWGELKEQGLNINSPLFREKLLGLSSDYSFNMTAADAAYWQKGLLSIPTQFWAYNQRMISAMLGSRFTPAQRIRLTLAQLGMAGAAGVPLVDTIASYVRERHDLDIDASPVLTATYRGLIDTAMKYGFDTDVRVGERLGTGSWLTQTVQDIFGLSQYGEKSTAEVLGGASGSIAWDTAGVLGDAVKYSFAESGGNTGMEVTKEDMIRLASEVSTVSNGLKAYLVSQYGYYRSNKGTVTADDVPSQDAFMVALGFKPQESDKVGHMLQVLNDNEEQVKEAATRVRNWRQEAFTNPDKYEENMKKVNTFINLLPPSIRLDVLKQTNKITDGSLYDHVAQKYQQQRLMKELDKTNGSAN